MPSESSSPRSNLPVRSHASRPMRNMRAGNMHDFLRAHLQGRHHACRFLPQKSKASHGDKSRSLILECQVAGARNRINLHAPKGRMMLLWTVCSILLCFVAATISEVPARVKACSARLCGVRFAVQIHIPVCLRRASPQRTPRSNSPTGDCMRSGLRWTSFARSLAQLVWNETVSAQSSVPLARNEMFFAIS